MKGKNEVLSGWGNYPKLHTQFIQSLSLRPTLKSIYRGLGRSYADQALSENGQTISTLSNNRILSLQNEIIKVQSGISIRELMQALIPKGFMIAVCPGTEKITVGGAIANNIHGKGHHIDCAFINSVKSFTLITTQGDELFCSRTTNSEFFWANAGGCGLLGLIDKVELWLKPISSAYFNTEAFKASSFAEMLELLDNQGVKSHYTVGWIDATKSKYPGVLVCGEHHKVADNSKEYLKANLKEPLSIPELVPNGLLNSTSTAVLNKIIGYKQAQTKGLVHYKPFFFPLDILANWNIGYGPKGFIQYQFVIPLEKGHENLKLILLAIRKAGCLPFLNVIKRFGVCENRFLSFPIEGYTLALDFPISKTVLALCKHLNTLVAQMGGRVYLAKDAVLDPINFRKMYPEVDSFSAIKKELDPEGILKSAQSERLNLG